ncbi:MAG: pitrilysin family protein [Burkholderiaceae bacterium]
MIRSLRLFVLALAAAAALLPAQAQHKLPPGVQRITSVEGVTEYRLANGLRVLLYPDASKPTATVNVTYLVGSRHENYGETGMAHLLEHLIFKGSKRFPNPDKEFARRGFRNNGTTWFDRTNYFSTFQASDDNLRWALAWSADAMVNSFIAKKDLDSEMTVVRNEYEMGENSPSRVLLQRSLSVMFDWHNYGNPTIGNRSDIENVRIENLQAFYRTYYQPDNAVLTVAGKFDEGRTLGWIAETFGRIPKPRRKLPVLWTVEPTQDGERSFAVRRQGDIQIVLVSYKIPSALHPDVDALGVASEILGNTPNGRLHKALVDQGLAAQVFSYLFPTHDPGVIMFGAVVKKGDPVERARERLIETVESTFAAQPATEAELQRVRRDGETTFERTLSNPEEFGVALSEYIALGDWRLFFLARDRLQQIQSADVGSVARKYFLRDNRTVGTFIPDDQPQRAVIPPAPSVAERLADFKPRAAAAAGEAFDPSQDNIDRRTRRVAIGDLKLALLPKKTRGETVDAALNFRWGDEKSLFGKSVLAQMTEAMIGRGTVRLTRQQIADEMTRLKMTGSLRQFQTDRAHLADALRLVAHVLREANFPEAEFETLKRETLTGLQAQLNDPAARSRDALLAHFNTYPEGDPRHYVPLAARIEAVNGTTLDDVKRFHAEFWGTARGEIAIVGDFDDLAIEALIRDVFPAWRSPAPYAPIVSEPRDVAPARIVVDTPDKENAFYRARINVALRDDDADYAPLLLANYVFGGGPGLANRLIDRVRQREGISYGAGSALLVGSRDRAGAWQIAGLVAPQNAARFEQAVREEIARMLKDGFTKKELEDAKNGLLQERQLNRAQDGVVAQTWVGYLDVGRTFAFSKQLEDRIRALTPSDVAAAVRRHIDPARLTVVVAGDAKKGVR